MIDRDAYYEKEAEILKALQMLQEEGGVPDFIFIANSTWWTLQYEAGRARYKPRIKGSPRKRRQKH